VYADEIFLNLTSIDKTLVDANCVEHHEELFNYPCRCLG